MSDKQLCPVCGDEWSWADVNTEKYRIAVSEAERICLTEDTVFIHNNKKS